MAGPLEELSHHGDIEGHGEEDSGNFYELNSEYSQM
jgi:hypothetical protein